jgi:hypothetical protein
LLVVPAAAQEEVPTLAVRLRRDFGYGSGMQMQGRFSYRVDAPEDVERVEFLLDDEVIGEDTEPPFALAFNTGGFDNGWHTLSARGYTAGGEQLISNTLQRQFVPARQSYLFAGAILLLVLAFVVARYLITRPRGTDASGNKRRTYGLLGGAICPACGRPFSLPIWSINLMAGRVARCPHCGKWNFVQRASSEALVAAEALEAELEEDSEVVVTSAGEKERLRRQLDDSRYEDR